MWYLLDSLLLQLVVVFVLLLLVTYFRIKSSFSYWTKIGIPIHHPTVPFGNFGNVIFKNSSFQWDLNRIYKETGGKKIIGLYGFNSKLLLIRDPEIIKNFLLRDFDHFHSRGLVVNEKADPLQSNLFFLSGTKWRKLRAKLTPVFTSGKMKMMFGILVESGKELKAVLQESANKREIIEVKDILARFTTDIIASCAFGIQCNCLKNPEAEFRIWGRKIFTVSYTVTVFRLVSFLLPFLIKYFPISITPRDVTNYFTKMVRETVEYREKNNVQRNDFMQLLINLKNKVKESDNEEVRANVGLRSKLEEEDNTLEMTMDLLAAQAFVFFTAGFETSSTTMTLCLYELALNPDIQERLRKEIDSVLQKHDGEITYESLFEMEYLDKVVHETLRKYPPVHNLFRACNESYRIPETDSVIEKGIRVFIPVMGLQHDPKYYPDPDRFDPERFSEEEKKKRPQFTYLPFGEGPRNCIGLRFGLMQTKVGLVNLLSSYKVHVSENTPVPLVFDKGALILTPTGGLQLRITNRNDNR